MELSSAELGTSPKQEPRYTKIVYNSIQDLNLSKQKCAVTVLSPYWLARSKFRCGQSPIWFCN